MINYIQINKFSELHDNNKIIFCKTDFLLSEFERIKTLDHDVILISGNSDYSIDDRIISLCPKNVKKWYAQNSLTYNDVLEPLPIGLENKLPSLRDGHGIGYLDRVTEKENLLNRNLDILPSKKIYSNFNINTNFSYRRKIKEISINTPHIDWEDSNLNLQEFFDKILEYESVVCPIGNGIDTHRLWEVLYSNRIPITIKVGDFKIYKLYEKLPIVILNNEKELSDYDLLESKINEVKNKKYNLEILDYSFWKNEILSNLK